MTLGICSIGTYLPKQKRSNVDAMEKFGFTQKFLKEKIGFLQLAYKDPSETTSNLCESAWKDLIQKHPIEVDDVDCLVVCTQNPDGHGLPQTSSVLHDKLGLSKRCATFDIALGCSGYVYSLSIVKSFMEANGLRKGLLFTADPYSEILDYEDKKTATLFADGATVTLISKDPVYKLGRFTFGSDGSGRNSIIVKDGVLQMNGRAVFAFSVRVVPESILEMLNVNSCSLDEIDRLIVHQGSRHIVKTIAKRLEIPSERCPFYAADYGNTISSSIPLVLADKLDRLDLKKVVISGFGVGLSWSSTLLTR